MRCNGLRPKNETEAELEDVAITVIQHALAIVEIVFPLDPKVRRVVDVPVQRRAG